jgi:hypothetical protein
VIAERLWAVAGVAGAAGDWENADACAALARRLGLPAPRVAHPLFRLACRLHAGRALRVRERFIRTFKPRMRVGYARRAAAAPGAAS